MYIGTSNCRASSIPLIYNPMTSHVTPQYHVTHDESFTSVNAQGHPAYEKVMEQLYEKATWIFQSKYDDEDALYYFSSIWTDPPPLSIPANPKKRTHRQMRTESTREAPAPGPTCKPPTGSREASAPSAPNTPREAIAPASTSSSEGAPPIAIIREATAPDCPSHSEGAFSITPIREANAPVSTSPSEGAHIESTFSADVTPIIPPSVSEGACLVPPPAPNPEVVSHAPLCHGHPQHVPRPCIKHQYHIHNGDPNYQDYKRCRGLQGNIYILAAMTSVPTLPPSLPPVFQHRSPVLPTFPDLPYIPTQTTINAYLATNNKEDTLTQSQMLKASDQTEFLHAQIPEIRGLESMNVFHYVSMSQLPPRARLLSSIWSYRRKRHPNGELIKHKARLCVDGSQQLHGRDYWETYAPVVSWPAIRLTLLLSIILGLKSRQVDYTQAFPQADLEDPVFMRLPQGWFVNSDGKLSPHTDPKHHDTTHFIRLKKNLYGCKQAARNWFQFLKQGILAQGFTQSAIDPCLFLRSD